MADSKIQTERVLSKLDEYFSKKDYHGAQRHLLYWLDEAKLVGDNRAVLLIANELIGLSRRMAEKEKAYQFSALVLDTLTKLDALENIGAATTYINIATSYKAFGDARLSLPLFEHALQIYTDGLEPYDERLGGLYNNMALTYADLEEYEKAELYFTKALDIMQHAKRGELECAITYLNMASAYEKRFGLLEAEDTIAECLLNAEKLLNTHASANDGYYAFVCEKCAPVFDYYGYFIYAKELYERSRRIYEGS